MPPGNFQAKHKIEVSLIVPLAEGGRVCLFLDLTLIDLPHKRTHCLWKRISKIITQDRL